MKKLLIFTAIIAALVLGLAACNGEKLVSLEDADAVENASGDDIPIGLATDGDIPVEDEAVADDNGSDSGKKGGSGAKKKTASGPGNNEVKIQDKKFGKLVLGEQCKFTVTATGKDTVMSVDDGLPPGLVAEMNGKALNIEGIPTKAGDFKFTIKAQSQSDSNKFDEKQSTMIVMEDLALNAYSLGQDSEGEWMWLKVEITSNLNISPGMVLRLEVRSAGDGKGTKDADKDSDSTDKESEDSSDEDVSTSDGANEESEPSNEEAGNAGVEDDGSKEANAEKYFWSLNGIECTGDECEKDGIILSSTNPYTDAKSPKNSVKFLTAGSEFIGQTIKTVTLKAWNDSGDKDSLTLSSLAFEKDPCSTPLALSSNNLKYDVKGFINPSQVKAHVNVVGGQGPYKWTITSADGAVQWKAPSGESESSNMTIDGTFTPPADASLKTIMEGKTFTSNFSVTDSCNTPQKVDGTFAVNFKDDDPPKTNMSGLSAQIDFGEINSTSSAGAYDEDTTYMVLKLLGTNDDELGRVYYDLEPCGDGGSASICEGIIPVDADTKWTKDKKAVLTDIKKVKIEFHDDICFMCGHVDVNIVSIWIFSNQWIAKYDDNKNGDRYDNNVVADEFRTDDITGMMEGYAGDALDIWRPRSEDNAIAISQDDPNDEDAATEDYVDYAAVPRSTSKGTSEIIKNTGLADDDTADIIGAVIDPGSAGVDATIDFVSSLF